VLNSVNINGTINRNNGNVAFNPNNGNYVSLYDPAGRVAIFLGTSPDQANYYDNSTHYFRNASASTQAVVNDSYLLHLSSVRSPIFYDYNNTGYYVDPASTSNVNTLNAATSLTVAGNAVAVLQAGGVVLENGQTINSNYTMTSSYNGMSAGPITVATGVTVTIPTGSSWSIV
jgi:hypothetical protein